MEYGLSLGCNLGDRLRNLQLAREDVAVIDGVHFRCGSPVYETEPVGVPPPFDDAPFFNVVVIVESELSPDSLAERLHDIEAGMGRTRSSIRNAPRPIDIDVIFAGQVRTDKPDLIIPHPRWSERRFVVQPLADIRPELTIPGQTETVAEILLSLPETPKVVLFTRDW